MSIDNVSMLMEGALGLGVLMHDVARLMRYRFDTRARALGVTRQQWRVLFILSREPGMTQAEVADLLEVERITLCRMVDRLAEAGMVERRADPNDRRVWRLHLLPSADAVVGDLTDMYRALEREMTADLPPAQMEALIEGLGRIRDRLREDDRRSAA